jgi:hypothetical protein
VNQLVTAAQLNAHVRDNEIFLKQAKVEHPYAGAYHIEASVLGFASQTAGQTSLSGATFTTPFSSVPTLTLGVSVIGDTGSNTNATAAPAVAWIYSISATAFQAYVRNSSNGAVTPSIYWIAIGPT